MKKYLFGLSLVMMGSIYFCPTIDAYGAGPTRTPSSSTATMHRRIIPLGSYTYTDLFALLPSGARHALFYLVDGQGNPLSGRDVVNAVGSKSIPAPVYEAVSPLLQNDMNTMKVQVTDDNQRWIESYLDRVHAYRSKGLVGSSIDAFNTAWNKVEQGYQKGLKQILRCITIPESDAYALGLQTVANAPITLLFFDDPFPPHSRPGSARSKFKDLLGDFIKGYNLSSAPAAPIVEVPAAPTAPSLSSNNTNQNSAPQVSTSLSPSQVATLRNRLVYYQNSVAKLSAQLDRLPEGSTQARQVQASINSSSLQIQKIQNQLAAAGY